MEVGVRELKKHLSKYLALAASGEVIRVTDRGHAKATLGPMPTESTLEKAIRLRRVTPGPGVDKPPRKIVRRFKSERTIQSVLDEDRGD